MGSGSAENTPQTHLKPARFGWCYEHPRSGPTRFRPTIREWAMQARVSLGLGDDPEEFLGRMIEAAGVA